MVHSMNLPSTPPTAEQIAARRHIAARAAEVRALRAVPAHGRLATAPLADVLLWGHLHRAERRQGPDRDPVQSGLRPRLRELGAVDAPDEAEEEDVQLL